MTPLQAATVVHFWHFAGGLGERFQCTRQCFALTFCHLTDDLLDRSSPMLEDRLDECPPLAAQRERYVAPIGRQILTIHEAGHHETIYRSGGIRRMHAETFRDGHQVQRTASMQHDQDAQLRERYLILDLGDGLSHDSDQHSRGSHHGIDLSNQSGIGG